MDARILKILLRPDSHRVIPAYRQAGVTSPANTQAQRFGLSTAIPGRSAPQLFK
ncbi:MAG: hypothetical protein JJE09_07115 [Bacteroidia bacterium]|nr:hypothetical protein [Bacteroidia bacterium]